MSKCIRLVVLLALLSGLFSMSSFSQRKLYEIGVDSVDILLVDTSYRHNLTSNIFDKKESTIQAAVRFDYVGVSFGLQELSFIHLRIEDYEQSLNYLFSARRFAEYIGDSVYIAIVNRRLGTVYTEMGINDKGLQYLMQAYNVLSNYQDDFCLDLVKTVRNIGLNHVLRHDNEKAREYFDESLDLAKSCDMRLELGSGYVNLSGVNIYFGIYDSITVYLDRALDIFEEFGDTLGMGTVHNNRAEYYMMIGEYEKSVSLYEKAFEYYTIVKEDNFRVSTLGNLAIIYERMGNSEMALEYSKHYAKANAMLLSMKLEKTIENMDASFMQKQMRKNIENELVLSKKESKIKSYQLYLLSSLLVIIVVMLVLFIYHRIAKERLIKVQLEKEKIAKSSLKSQINFKDRELEGLALNITNKNRFLHNLSGELDEINSHQDKDTQGKIRDVKYLISQYLQSDKELADFNKQVELLQQNFFYVLMEEFPDLSENDKQLCVLLRLEISSKDIALMRNVSEKSVHMARYRLRKKMHLDSNDNLVEYLKRI
ncbi:MAG: tetratricopeptide repeat protein [Bacteroidota bacterium]|nr:tetratricopeptide repeat protein [Bacteroidota bacterium]